MFMEAGDYLNGESATDDDLGVAWKLSRRGNILRFSAAAVCRSASATTDPNHRRKPRRRFAATQKFCRAPPPNSACYTLIIPDSFSPGKPFLTCDSFCPAGEQSQVTPLERCYKSQALVHFPENVEGHPLDPNSVNMVSLRMSACAIVSDA